MSEWPLEGIFPLPPKYALEWTRVDIFNFDSILFMCVCVFSLLYANKRVQYGCWSAAGHSCVSLIWQDPICAGLHDTKTVK